MASPFTSSIAEWNERFAIAGVATMVAGQGGLPAVRVTTPAAQAEIYLQGAQVTSWQPAGAEQVLFLSSQSRWEEGRAIRGGIPICFPWFRGKADNPQAPAHGFVRTRAWHTDALTQHGETVALTLSTTSDDASRRWFPHEFRIEHRIHVGGALTLELEVTNLGATAFTFEEALHTYHKVGDVSEVQVTGLDQARYLDNTENNLEKVQGGPVLFAAPTDNAYLDTHATLAVADPGMRRLLRTRKENSATTVVWNPWKQGAAALSDLGDGEWRSMACVEASNILDAAILLAPGAQHIMRAAIEVDAL